MALSYEELVARLEALEQRQITLKDLPLAQLQRRLELGWNPEAKVLLQKASVTPSELATVPYARVYNSGALPINSGVVTAMTFDSERADTDGIHSTTANTDRLTCVTAGFYLIIAQARFAANNIGNRELTIEVNGTTRIAVKELPNTGATTTFLDLATLYPLAAGDFVRANVWQNSGVALNVLASPNFSPEFMMIRLSA